MSMLYNIITMANVKSVNHLLKSAWEFSIVDLTEYIRETLQMWFYGRYDEIEKCVTNTTYREEDAHKI